MARRPGKRQEKPQQKQGFRALVVMPLHRDQEGKSLGEKDTMKRTLYECSHARVKGSRIYCEKGYVFSLKSNNGGLDVKRLARGDPLVLAVCQDCLDFDSMGPPIQEEERGWVRKKTTRLTHRTSRRQKKEVVH